MNKGSLYVKSEREALQGRIASVRVDSARQWGRMEPGQMLAHCQVALRVSLGEQQIPRVLIGYLFGRLAMRGVMGAAPLKRNLPTGREFRFGPGLGVERERATLLSLVERFGAGGPAAIAGEVHPFFGKLTVEEWDRLHWKHIDHHLRQFGA